MQMEFNPLDAADISRKVIELQQFAKSLGVDVDCIRMQQAFLEQDKLKYDSFKPYIGTAAYIPLMYGRHVRVLGKIKQTINAKFSYSKDVK